MLRTMKRPTQSVFIREEGKTYAFDAVVKIETQTSLKIAEQASDVSNKAHVNYAITQPNQVEMEVAVSDTVTVSNEPLTKGSGKRSLLAHQCLIAMQRRRNLLTVITPSYSFSNMMIESISQEANDDFQDGEFHANIVFKEMTVVPKKKKKTASKKKADGTKPPADDASYSYNKQKDAEKNGKSSTGNPLVDVIINGWEGVKTLAGKLTGSYNDGAKKK